MPYLVCDKCNTYYKLKKDESARDPQNLRFWGPRNGVSEGFTTCECGNKLEYYKYIGDYTQRSENQDVNTKNEGILNLWSGQSTGIKLVSIVAVLLLGILVIAGVSGTFSNNNHGNKSTLIVLYAPWCSSCDKFEQTFQIQRLRKKSIKIITSRK